MEFTVICRLGVEEATYRNSYGIGLYNSLLEYSLKIYTVFCGTVPVFPPVSREVSSVIVLAAEVSPPY